MSAKGGRPKIQECNFRIRTGKIPKESGKHPHCRKSANVRIVFSIKGQIHITMRCYEHYVAFETYARKHSTEIQIVSTEIVRD